MAQIVPLLGDIETGGLGPTKATSRE